MTQLDERVRRLEQQIAALLRRLERAEAEIDRLRQQIQQAASR